jgi:hypothetical protein
VLRCRAPALTASAVTQSCVPALIRVSVLSAIWWMVGGRPGHPAARPTRSAEVAAELVARVVADHRAVTGCADALASNRSAAGVEPT